MLPDDLSQSVSRETLESLNQFVDLLKKWNPKINLVAKSSMADVWIRHIWDSAQLFDYGRDAPHWVDIGSGGGFPGCIIAILSKRIKPARHFTFVESDNRKSAFLRTVIRTFDLPAIVMTERVEAIKPLEGDILSARALASLDCLLEYAKFHLNPEGVALFLKGETWEKEVSVARNSWSFQLNAHKSKTNTDAALLEIKDISRV